MNDRRLLFLASLTALFLELMLIRWISTEIPMLAYLKNFPLLTAFTGLGIGCLLADSRFSFWTPSLWVLGALTLGVCLADRFGLDKMVFPEPNLNIWDGFLAVSVTSPLLLTVRNLSIVFLILAANGFAFIGPGQAIGRLLKRGAPLQMYSADILGSLAGVFLFALLSFLNTAPFFWLAVLLVLLWRVGRALRVATRWMAPPLALLVIAAVLTFWRLHDPGVITRWSPYYKIQVQETAGTINPHGKIYELFVNHYIHQNMIDLSKAVKPHAYDESKPLGNIFNVLGDEYNLPYYVKPRPAAVLIAGAGTGNDAAAALRNHAGRVTAVEIDPMILRLGREMHPERPYASDKVEIVNNDIRSYLRRTDRKFDLIVYSILDSHTALSSLSSIRLDNYVYTAEGLRDAVSRLKPDGVVCLSFYGSGNPWLNQRLFNTIRQANGGPPVSTNLGPIACFVFGPGLNRAQTEARLATLGYPISPMNYEGPVKPSTDDWPFLYSSPKGEPWIYYLSLVLIILFSAVLVYGALRLSAAGSLSPRGLDWHMFFLGAGFLLVETKALAELSLLFGSTWVVNTFVFAGVFVMVLLANFTVNRWGVAGRLSRLAYPGLILSLLAWYFFPRAVLNGLDFAARGALGTTLVVLPLFFAGLIFAASFARHKNANLAFGANLLGAVVGGAMEAASLAWGIRALTLLAIGFYLLSLITRGRRAPQAGEIPADRALGDPSAAQPCPSEIC